MTVGVPPDKVGRLLWVLAGSFALLAVWSGPALKRQWPLLAVVVSLERERSLAGPTEFVSVGGGDYWASDPWGQPYVCYEVHSGTYAMYSCGPNGLDESRRGDDIVLDGPELEMLIAALSPWLPVLAWRVEYGLAMAFLMGWLAVTRYIAKRDSAALDLVVAAALSLPALSLLWWWAFSRVPGPRVSAEAGLFGHNLLDKRTVAVPASVAYLLAVAALRRDVK